ncbi:probable WRKY transcription factor 13 [Oryza brachyantha]|uniref:probable WRKY transcription factor 13 n=1 Tax=Oryza brachyantha TaxID=4533 RepID=UPI001ADAF599|nr:probable WRKY transcription factor 13 [Oryza brachyantha]
MFPSPGRAVMALGQHGAMAAAVASSSTTSPAAAPATVAFTFQPSPTAPHTGAAAPAAALPHHHHHHHHGILGYSPLVLDHPTTAATSSSPHAAPCPTTLRHGLHAAPPPPTLPSHPPRSSPATHPWSCEEGDRGRQRGKGAAAVMGTGRIIDDDDPGGSYAAAAGPQQHPPHHQLAVGAVRMKKAAAGGKARRKVREPRFCFKTMSDVDVLDDGYKWRKYGQKVVKNTQHPRSYYRCTQDNCRVKKRVERLAEDPRMVITTYEGRHVHSPSRDDDDAARATAEMTFIW